MLLNLFYFFLSGLDFNKTLVLRFVCLYRVTVALNTLSADFKTARTKEEFDSSWGFWLR